GLAEGGGAFGGAGTHPRLPPRLRASQARRCREAVTGLIPHWSIACRTVRRVERQMGTAATASGTTVPARASTRNTHHGIASLASVQFIMSLILPADLRSTAIPAGSARAVAAVPIKA